MKIADSQRHLDGIPPARARVKPSQPTAPPSLISLLGNQGMIRLLRETPQAVSPHTAGHAQPTCHSASPLPDSKPSHVEGGETTAMLERWKEILGLSPQLPGELPSDVHFPQGELRTELASSVGDPPYFEHRATDLNHHAFHMGRNASFDVGNRAQEEQEVLPRIEPERTPAVQRLHASPRAIQRFESLEHKEIGDDATKAADGVEQRVELATGYRMTYGEMVALAGDFFESIDQMREFARQPGPGKGTREEIEYARQIKVPDHEDTDAVKEQFSEAARNEVNRRYYHLAANNREHFVHPEDSDARQGPRELAAQGHRRNAGASYREMHENAIHDAIETGQRGDPIEFALATEAFSNHFLTDAFSAGHLRTPRVDLQQWWHPRFPMFFHNFKGFMAQKIAIELNKGPIVGTASIDLLYEESLVTIETTFKEKGMPEFTFGDIVSGALHDFDNAKGVGVTIAGQLRVLYGDHHLAEGDTNAAVLAAVRASVKEVQEAYAYGKAEAAKPAPENIFPSPFVEHIKAVNGGLFAAETLLPRVEADADQTDKRKSLTWQFDTVEELMQDARFQEAAIICLKGKMKELEKIGKDLDAEYKREAFAAGVVRAIKDDAFGVLKEVIEWTPETGGGAGGHNTDDEALDYYLKAEVTPSALGTLTYPAKERLIRDLLTGVKVASDEENALFNLLVARDGDAQALIARFGWDRLEDELGERFSSRFPKSDRPTGGTQ